MSDTSTERKLSRFTQSTWEPELYERATDPAVIAARQRLEAAAAAAADAVEYRAWANREFPDRLENAESAIDQAEEEVWEAEAALCALEDAQGDGRAR